MLSERKCCLKESDKQPAISEFVRVSFNRFLKGIGSSRKRLNEFGFHLVEDFDGPEFTPVFSTNSRRGIHATPGCIFSATEGNE